MYEGETVVYNSAVGKTLSGLSRGFTDPFTALPHPKFTPIIIDYPDEEVSYDSQVVPPTCPPPPSTTLELGTNRGLGFTTPAQHFFLRTSL